MARKSEDRKKFENHPNPFNLPYATIRYRIRKGETFEKAMSYPLSQNRQISKDKIKFLNH